LKFAVDSSKAYELDAARAKKNMAIFDPLSQDKDAMAKEAARLKERKRKEQFHH
jgi:hypothetical protein